jgi:hypothetical protein
MTHQQDQEPWHPGFGQGQCRGLSAHVPPDGPIRTFEDNANQLYLSAKMPGLTHMYSGEEAVAVGICEA